MVNFFGRNQLFKINKNLIEQTCQKKQQSDGLNKTAAFGTRFTALNFGLSKGLTTKFSQFVQNMETPWMAPGTHLEFRPNTRRDQNYYKLEFDALINI